MSEKIVSIGSGGKKKIPKLVEVDLDKVRSLSMSRMSKEHIALMLDITMEEFTNLKTHSVPFQNALERGRAEAVHACAQVVLRAAQGQLGTLKETKDKDGNVISTERLFGDKEREQLKAAQEYLARHAPQWQREN